MTQVIQTDGAPAAIGPYSQAVLVDGWLYASGQIALDPATGEVVPGDVTAQTERVLANLRAVLAAAGGGFQHVVKTTVYLRRLETFAEMNAAYGRIFESARPARATVEVSRLPKDVLVEIDLVARIPT